MRCGSGSTQRPGSRTRNPWTMLQDISAERLESSRERSAHSSPSSSGSLEPRQAYLETPELVSSAHGAAALSGVAYFSMEFGLGEAMPLYAGGLGVLAGDFLKTASDLGLPVIGVGLLYQEGYFRQIVDAAGAQHEVYPLQRPRHRCRSSPRIVRTAAGFMCRSSLPGRTVSAPRLAGGGRARHALSARQQRPAATAPPTAASPASSTMPDAEIRLMQEIVLGIGGWRAVEALAPEVEICHLNEGHAAFAVIERARHHAARAGLAFWEALWATRAGNLFTTHTPVTAGFDRFRPDLSRKYCRYVGAISLDAAGIAARRAAGARARRPDDASEPFNMAYLAMRGSRAIIGVSRLHGEVSRRHLPAALSALAGSARSRSATSPTACTCPTWDSAGSRRSLDRGLRQGAVARASPDALTEPMRALSRRATVGHARRGSERAGAQCGAPSGSAASSRAAAIRRTSSRRRRRSSIPMR